MTDETLPISNKPKHCAKIIINKIKIKKRGGGVWGIQ
jgi:hypothetical protein